eukprot:CAMPEP_0206161238 /NCGR_PEP_ID=MMETSP1474-20131121/7482_1 /ASSEMBLY_ACC=CAM_ASM_001110 /TAXON_ID=97495 /ORGANISM="Imantonia sp., Strain RCC918" /LENGTH=66 /DNA_ID=CAMNT_0053563009 /DNA_START=453 /DNA_END=649 /DNA_ORIENTATION=-
MGACAAALHAPKLVVRCGAQSSGGDRATKRAAQREAGLAKVRARDSARERGGPSQLEREPLAVVPR